jgi:hypothetical protein
MQTFLGKILDELGLLEPASTNQGEAGEHKKSWWKTGDREFNLRSDQAATAQ